MPGCEDVSSVNSYRPFDHLDAGEGAPGRGAARRHHGLGFHHDQPLIPVPFGQVEVGPDRQDHDVGAMGQRIKIKPAAARPQDQEAMPKSLAQQAKPCLVGLAGKHNQGTVPLQRGRAHATIPLWRRGVVRRSSASSHNPASRGVSSPWGLGGVRWRHRQDSGNLHDLNETAQPSMTMLISEIPDETTT